MVSCRLVNIICVAIFAAGVCSSAGAAYVDPVEINVKGRVWISIPSGWTFFDQRSRTKLSENTRKITGSDLEFRVASLAVNSYPPPVKNIVRVTFFPLDGPVTESDFKMLLDNPRERKALFSEFEQEREQMEAMLGKMGARLLSKEPIKRGMLAGRTALIASHRRTSPVIDQGFDVTLYIVALGDAMAFITLSHAHGDREAASDEAHIRKSIRIK